MKRLARRPEGVTFPRDFLAAGVEAGIKPGSKGKKDVALIFSPVPCRAAAVYTTNRFRAAPLVVTAEHLADGLLRAVVINSGNANACTGEAGIVAARRMAAVAARELKVESKEVAVASTGVIGVPLPMERVERGIIEAARSLSAEGGGDAALAIMTTDTYPKETALSLEIGRREVRLGAMAKGAGMICPNMATMLCFLTTDAAISGELLQEALRECVADTFNMISVDGDTSTNDMVLIMASGLAGNPEIKEKNEDYRLFREALYQVCLAMAKAIVRDGEGATRLMEVRVRGARERESARKAVRAIINSNLVKTALFGADANWGRIVCALGYSGAEFNPARVDVYLGDIPVARGGQGLPFSEEEARTVLTGDEVKITVDLNEGKEEAVGWGCDLTYDYVRINADYRT